MKYERLTDKKWKEIEKHCYAKGLHFSNQFTEEETDKMIKRLADLEDKIESGKMLELPCKMKLNISDYNVDVYQIIYSGKYGYMRTEIVYGEVEAEARLKELQGE